MSTRDRGLAASSDALSSGRLDARSKLVWLVATFIATLISTSLVVQVALLIMALAMLALGLVLRAITFSEVRKPLLSLVPLLLAITLIQSAVRGGAAILAAVPIGPWAMVFTAEGLEWGLVLAFRLAALAIAFLVFLATTTPYQLSMALYKLGLPFRYALLATIALELFPVAVEHSAQIQLAQACRGFEIERGSVFRRARNVLAVAIPVIVFCLRKGVDMATALELRGFGRHAKVSFLRDQQLGLTDVVVIALSLIGLVLVVGVRVSGWTS